MGIHPRRPLTRPPRVSRDEIVNIITKFYTFLTKMYIPESALKLPPEGGWPNITPETTKNFGKAPMVIDLMKHLPYIDDTESHNFVTNIQYKCDVVDYSTWKPEEFTEEGGMDYQEFLEWHLEEQAEYMKDREERDGEENGGEDEEDGYSTDEDELDDEEWWNRYMDDLENEIPFDQVLVLARGYESGGRTFVLDVYKGLIHDHMIRYEYLGSSGVEDFFRDLHKKYERLELVPVPSGPEYEGDVFEDVPEIEENEVLRDPMERLEKSSGDAAWDDDDDGKWFKQIYRKHGWPKLQQYRKEECLAEIKKYTSAEGIW